MTTNKWILAIMISAVSWVACDDDKDDDKPSLNETDETFVERAALNNMTEIKFGELASAKATDSLVKDFGQEMVAEHTTAQSELKSIADSYDDVKWTDEMDQPHKDLYAQLNNLTGYSFDSLYMRSQVADHQSTLAIFDTQLNTGTVDKVKAYATKYHPHIEEHYQKADSVENIIIMNNENTDGNIN